MKKTFKASLLAIGFYLLSGAPQALAGQQIPHPAETIKNSDVSGDFKWNWPAICRRARFVPADCNWCDATWTAVCHTGSSTTADDVNWGGINWGDATWAACHSTDGTPQDVSWGAVCQSGSGLGTVEWEDATWTSVCSGGSASPNDSNGHATCQPR